MNRRVLCILALLLGTATLGLATVWAGSPAGGGPDDPLMITSSGQTINAGDRLWFYFDYTGANSRAQVLVDAGGSSDIDLALYTPEQAEKWIKDQTTAPVGRGSKPGSGTSIGTYDLSWQGAFNAAGSHPPAGHESGGRIP